MADFERPTYSRGEEILFPVEKNNYLKGIITRFIRATGMAMITEVSTGDEYECEVALLEKIMSNDINYKFQYYEDLAKLTIFKELKALIVTGEGGIGKSYVIQQVLGAEEFEEDTDYVYVKGHVSPFALYQLLEENWNKPIIFDDCDAILKDATSQNIIKAVTDSYAVRKVKWLTSAGVRERVSKSFNFTGSVIFLSNLALNQFPQAIISRSTYVDLAMTPEEKVERIRHIIKYLPEMDDIPAKDKERLVNMLDKYKNLLNDFNLRSLIKASNILRTTGSWEYVRMSILDS